MDVEKYIEEVLGIESSVYPVDKHTLDALPLYITTPYKIERLSLFGKDIFREGLILLFQINNYSFPT